MPSIMGWKVGGELKQFLLVALYMYGPGGALIGSIGGAFLGRK